MSANRVDGGEQAHLPEPGVRLFRRDGKYWSVVITSRCGRELSRYDPYCATPLPCPGTAALPVLLVRARFAKCLSHRS